MDRSRLTNLNAIVLIGTDDNEALFKGAILAKLSKYETVVFTSLEMIEQLAPHGTKLAQDYMYCRLQTQHTGNRQMETDFEKKYILPATIKNIATYSGSLHVCLIPRRYVPQTNEAMCRFIQQVLDFLPLLSHVDVVTCPVHFEPLNLDAENLKMGENLTLHGKGFHKRTLYENVQDIADYIFSCCSESKKQREKHVASN